MKQKLWTLMILLSLCVYSYAQQIIKPGVKTPTTFAIVVDSTSYENAKSALEAYKQSVEADGLGTYLLVHNWKSPEQIRELLIQLHSDRKSPLEGCVFVGDIPIPMLRDAQHLTSAFKMDQKHDWKESSVPSDRFYDDFELKFDFLKQDADIPLYFYYSLRADSKQYLSPDIYSARIKPLELEGVDKYQLLNKYLEKVVKEKQENANNVLDYLSMGRGHGYNSEDPIAWAGEQLAIREQLPQLFRPGSTVKFFDFDVRFPIKNSYLNEIQSEGLDVMLFHHHGASDTQYLNGYEEVSSIGGSIENVKRFLRSKIPSFAEKKGREAAITAYMENYNVPREWCEEAFDPEKIKEDSLYNLSLDIYTTDIHPLKPQARFVMFDACFNGSFYEKDNIAGAYIFSEGKTLVTQGGTVNTIQDKWPDEFLGLLGAGMRVGQLNRLVCYLENHLIGDPTFHFANNSGVDIDINRALVLEEGNMNYWKRQLKSSLPDLRALALKELCKGGYESLPELLEETYFTSDYFVVRLEAMRLLALNYPEKAIKVLQAALNDGYELVRRLACEYVEKNGHPDLIPAFIQAYLNRQHESRLNFKLLSGIGAFDANALLQELDKQVANRRFYDSLFVERIRKQIEQNEKNTQVDMKEMFDTKAKLSRVRLDIVIFRNHPSTVGIDPLLKFASDDTRDKILRLTAIETLGWFNENYRRGDIVSGLKQIKTDDKELKHEIDKTIHRLIVGRGIQNKSQCN
ncbi:HEAT repeat domain-containing protein [Phocaeicola coprocola]|uniref:HEAT repeat domain-containing protein n=1 Tax=Phocaeicola coprocola TaxID=310298 RepID=UPI00242D4DDE|nr:HEAT repeat domain-containing protein [Phocaeicola coprocola]